MTDNLWAARRERARRWILGGNHDLRGYPALSADEENEETLTAEPVEKVENRSTPRADTA